VAMTATAVSTYVNNAQHQGPECIAAVGGLRCGRSRRRLPYWRTSSRRHRAGHHFLCARRSRFSNLAIESPPGSPRVPCCKAPSTAAHVSSGDCGIGPDPRLAIDPSGGARSQAGV
jgi:hypothetical protein